MFYLAELLPEQVKRTELYKDTPEALEKLIPIQSSERTKESMRHSINYAKQLQEAYGNLDAEQQETESAALYDQVIEKFSDTRTPLRYWEGPADIRLIDKKQRQVVKRWPIADRARFQRFQLTRLKIGQPAPELEGSDLYHQPIKLSDFAGKVVVLTVTHGTVGEEKKMSARCAELLKEFKGQPLVCLSVVPTEASGGYGVRQIVRETGITWPIIRDPLGRPIANQWCQETFPEAYIIDKQGFLRYHEWSKAVSPALQEQVRDMLFPKEQL